MATEIKKLRPESIRTTGASANNVLTISGGETVFANELSLSGLNIGTSDSLAGKKLNIVGDVEISGALFQSGSLFTSSPDLTASGFLTEGSASGTYSNQFNVSVVNDGGNKYYLSEVTGASHTSTSQVQQLEIYLQRGNTYKFTTDSSTNTHPFIFVTQGAGGAYTYEYTSGVTNSRAQNGSILYFKVPQSVPDTLYYQCGAHGNMGGTINIVGAVSYTHLTLPTKRIV